MLWRKNNIVFPHVNTSIYRGNVSFLCHFRYQTDLQNEWQVSQTPMTPSSLPPLTVPLLRQTDCPSPNPRHWLSQRLTTRLFKNVQYLKMSRSNNQYLYMRTSKMVIERKQHARLHSLFETYPQSVYALNTSHFTRSKLKFIYHALIIRLRKYGVHSVNMQNDWHKKRHQKHSVCLNKQSDSSPWTLYDVQRLGLSQRSQDSYFSDILRE